MTFVEFEDWIKVKLDVDTLHWIAKKPIGTVVNDQFTSYLGTVLCTKNGVSRHGRKAIKYEYRRATDEVLITIAGSDTVFDPMGDAPLPDPLPALAVEYAKSKGFATAVIENILEPNKAVLIRAFKIVDAQNASDTMAIVFRKLDASLDHRILT